MDASSIVNDINQGRTPGEDNTCLEVGRHDALTGFWETYLYLGDPVFDWVGTNFSVFSGESYYVSTGATTSWTISGAHDPGFEFDLPASQFGSWISLPYHAQYDSLADILEDINGINDITQGPGMFDSPQYANQITRYNPQSGEYENVFWNDFMWLSSVDNPETPDIQETPHVVPGEGYNILTLQNFTWRPAVIGESK